MSAPQESTPANPALHLHAVLAEEYRALHNTEPLAYQDSAPPANAEPPSPEAAAALARARLRAIIRDFHARPRAALCISGGGIRSGTFALGVMQGLAKLGVLVKFHFLSTVSGGGYIGSWLTAWVHHTTAIPPDQEEYSASTHAEWEQRRKAALTQVEAAMCAAPTDPQRPEPAPIEHLRAYSNYLSPQLGALSADTWTLVAIVLRNIILNWLVLVPFLLAALAIPRLVVAVTVWRHAPDRLSLATIVAGGLLLAWTFGYMGTHLPSARRKAGRTGQPPEVNAGQKEFAQWCLAPLLAGTALLTTAWAWWCNASGRHLPECGYFLAFGAGVHLLSYLGMVFIGREKFRPPFLFVVLATGAFGGAVLWKVFTGLFAHPVDLPARYCALAAPLFLGVVLLAMILYIGLVSWEPRNHQPIATDEDREWWARAGGWVLIGCLVWLGVSGVALFGPRLLALGWKSLSAVGGLSGLAALLLGAGGKSGANEQKAGEEKGLLATVTSRLPELAAPIFAAFLLTLLSIGTTAALGKINPVIKRAFPPARPAAVTAAPAATPAPAATTPASTPPAAAADQAAALPAAATDQTAAKPAAETPSDSAKAPAPAPAANIAAATPKPSSPETTLTINAVFKAGTNPPGQLEARADPGKSFHWWPLPDGLFHHDKVLRQTRWWVCCLLIIVLAVIAFGASWLINANMFSVHGMYRDRLVRAYLGASRLHGQRHPHPFTGFDPNDNVPMRCLWPQPGIRGNPDDPGRRLFPVINIALNLVHGENLAWQERKAASFTVTPLHGGSSRIMGGLGYRRTEPDGAQEELKLRFRPGRYGGDGGISLGTALAISGAAASPNWGYHSSAPVTFIMALFNVRLGWWLGNPGPDGNTTYDQRYPRQFIPPLIQEAFGFTDDTAEAVYLSDGGHFDNMGLYEMVLRRCRLIVLSDGEQDGEFTFGGLGMAVRKIRIDFGITVDFPAQPLFDEAPDRPPHPTKPTRCAIGRIRYSEVDEGAADGVLIYLKPVRHGDEPRDVVEYARSHLEFPHETTLDQFFTESQFESYRELGRYTVDQISATAAAPALEPWLEAICQPGCLPEFAPLLRAACAAAAKARPAEHPAGGA